MAEKKAKKITKKPVKKSPAKKPAIKKAVVKKTPVKKTTKKNTKKIVKAKTIANDKSKIAPYKPKKNEKYMKYIEISINLEIINFYIKIDEKLYFSIYLHTKKTISM